MNPLNSFVRLYKSPCVSVNRYITYNNDFSVKLIVYILFTLPTFFQADFLPGLLFFVVAILSFLSILCVLVLPETNSRTLVDNILDNLEEDRRKETITSSI